MPPEKMWHVSRNKKQYGPFTAAQLQAMAAKGNLVANDLVRLVGTQVWVAARQCEGLVCGIPSLKAGDVTSKPADTEGASIAFPARPAFDVGDKAGQMSPPQRTGASKRKSQVLSMLASASIACFVCFAIGFFVANSLNSGKKQRASAGDAQVEKASAPTDSGPATWLRRYQSVPDTTSGQQLSKMPKELQGQWVDEWISGDQGETFTRPADRAGPRAFMFENAWCFGSSDLSDSEDLDPYLNIVRLPAIEGQPAWAIKVIEGYRYIVHGTGDKSVFVIRDFEDEGDAARAGMRSLTKIKPHTKQGRAFAATATSPIEHGREEMPAPEAATRQSDVDANGRARMIQKVAEATVSAAIKQKHKLVSAQSAVNSLSGMASNQAYLPNQTDLMQELTGLLRRQTERSSSQSDCETRVKAVAQAWIADYLTRADRLSESAQESTSRGQETSPPSATLEPTATHAKVAAPVGQPEKRSWAIAALREQLLGKSRAEVLRILGEPRLKRPLMFEVETWSYEKISVNQQGKAYLTTLIHFHIKDGVEAVRKVEGLYDDY